MIENPGGLLPALLGTVQGLVISSLVVLAIFAGFIVLLNLPKLRARNGGSKVVRSLDEALGRPESYLPPDAPCGPADQLRTPELLEAQARKTLIRS